MRFSGRLSIAALCVAVSLAFILVCFSCRDDSKPRGVVVLYCSVDQVVAEPILAEFERTSGIHVKVRYDTEASKTVGLVQRIRAEASSPVADVFWSSEIFNTIMLSREGLLSPWTSNQVKNWPDAYKASDGTWYGLALRGRVIAYNSRNVDANDAPRSLEDLLEPRWKGRLVMAVPQFGTTGGDIASWFVHYGPERATEILRGLKANKVHLVPGNSTAVRLVATGQADVCMTDTDDVYAAKRNDWPVECNPLDQGGDGSLAIPNTAAVIKGAPHPEQASVLMEFILSGAVERMLAESDSHNCPVGDELASQYEEYAIKPVLQVDYEKVADMLNTSIETSMEILR